MRSKVDEGGRPRQAILVLFDTLNRRFLPPFGNEWVHAPNFSRLAERTVTFDTCYGGSMPCVPARRELHTGRYNFLHRGWGPLEPYDDSMPELLGNNGVYTHLASDHQHYWEDGGATYHGRYNSWEFFRGQEGDAWKGMLADPEIPETLRLSRHKRWRQDWVNRGYLAREEDHPQTRTFDAGLEFIRTNRDAGPWFLHLETFDPHEPFFTYKQYQDLYPHAYDGPHFDWPEYKRVTERPSAVEHVRYEYAALLSMCDHSLGQLLDTMDELELWDDTLLVVCTDHGFLLGEHGWWGKSAQPWYDETIHTPLFIWDPRSGRHKVRRSSLVQTIDIAPTVLEYFGVEQPSDMQGKPLTETITHDRPVRSAGLFGIFGGHVNVTDGRHVYMRAPVDDSNQPLFAYTLMPTHMRARFHPRELRGAQLADPFTFTKGCSPLRVPATGQRNAHAFGSLLFDLTTDPQQSRPMVDDQLELTMVRAMATLMRDNDAPLEQFARLGLPSSGEVTGEHLLARRQRRRAEQVAAELPRLEDLPAGQVDLARPLADLIADPAIADAIDAAQPGLLRNPRLKAFGHLPLLEIAALAPGVLDGPLLRQLAAALAALDLYQER